MRPTTFSQELVNCKSLNRGCILVSISCFGYIGNTRATVHDALGMPLGTRTNSMNNVSYQIDNPTQEIRYLVHDAGEAKYLRTRGCELPDDVTIQIDDEYGIIERKIMYGYRRTASAMKDILWKRSGLQMKLPSVTSRLLGIGHGAADTH